jgi:hypothetical protein
MMWWLVPAIVSVGCVQMMLYPTERDSGDYALNLVPLLRLLWLVPALAAWIAYLVIALLTGVR